MLPTSVHLEGIEKLTQDEVTATVDGPLLEQQLTYVVQESPFYQHKLLVAGMDAREARALGNFEQWPFTEKAELLADQEANPPFGRLAVTSDRLCRIHMTSGSSGRPLYVPLTQQDVEATREAGGRAFRCAGLVPADCVVHCLNYCMWAGGVTDHMSLEATGATVIPFGVGNTRRLIETILELRPNAISCTPSYMSRLEVVLRDEFQLAPPELGLQKAFFGGEGGLQDQAVRQRLEGTWHLEAIDANYGMTDVLSIFGAECPARTGLHFHGQGILYLEVLDPETGAVLPVEAGQVGEMVLTNLRREAQPLVRYRTKDVIRVIATDLCACGRRSFRFNVVGRSDEMIVVSGVNVYPSAVRSLLARHPQWFSGEFEFVIDAPPPIEHPLLRVELAGQQGPTAAEDAERQLLRMCHDNLSFTPRVELVDFGRFPRTEGKTKHIRKIHAEGVSQQTVQAITGADIAAFLGRPLQGASLPIRKPADLAACGDGDLAWVLSYTSERLAHLEQGRPSLAIVDPETAGRTTVPHICCENPRLAFSQVLQAFFIAEPPPAIHSTALVHPQAVIGQRVSIGPYARIGPSVIVGDDSVIGSGVSIEGEVVLGMRCRVKANSVIGAPGFGFAYDEDGVPVHFPHIGNVVFEDDVWVGACSTVECGALSSTRLCHGVKVDDLVQIGHNVQVGANTLVTANAVLCGRVVVGEGCWIAPNSVVKEGVRIGDGAKVGMGAVVLRDVEPGTVVAGVPAKPLEKKC